MSTKIKPQHGVTYECYKGCTDSYGDYCRPGQKFKWSTEHDEHEFTGYYVMEKASGRGVNIAVPVGEFQSYFIPVDAKEYISNVNEPQQNTNQFNFEAMLISALKAFEEQMQEQHSEHFITHKIGNRYQHEDGNRYLLVGGRTSNQVALVNLKTGKMESYKVAVDDTDNITASEFSELCFDSNALKLIKERQ